MKSDPPKGGTKNDSKLPEETKVVRKEPELGAVEAGGAGDQLTIAEMENVTTVFRTNVNVTYQHPVRCSNNALDLVPQIDPSVKLYNHGEGPYYDFCVADPISR